MFPKAQSIFQVISAKPELKLRQHLVDGRIVQVSAAFVFACLHLQGLEGGAMTFVCMGALASRNSNFLRSDIGVGSEWSCWHFYERRCRRPSSPEDIGTDYKCCSGLLSGHTVRSYSSAILVLCITIIILCFNFFN